jgi:hypothetical protein
LFVIGFGALLLMTGFAEAKVRCTMEYAPVCAAGPHGKRTYDNPSCARAARARVLHEGRCAKDVDPSGRDLYGPRSCAMENAPVCAERGGARLTFPNTCFAITAGAEVVSWGACWF